MTKNVILSIAITALVFGGGGFYAGIKYGQSKFAKFSLQDAQNMPLGERQEMFQQFRDSGSNSVTGRRINNGQGSGFIGGEIIAKDDKSITIKTPDGSSKIIFYSDATEIGKSAIGSASDLEVGNNISASGTPNQEGSLTAKSIQVRAEDDKPVE
jgi:hypothetical protein